MKKFTSTILALVGITVTGQAAVVLNDNFNGYPPGPLVGAFGSPWVTHSGTPNQVNVVPPGQVHLTQAESEDVNAPLAGGPQTAANLYACFVMNLQALPSGSGGYFAHFKDSGTVNFRARVFVTTTNVTAGRFRIGIANLGNTAVFVPTDLSPGVNYPIVVRYMTNGQSTIWISPASEASLINRADGTDSLPAPLLQTVAFAWRQSLSGANGMGTLTVDDLRVATTFAECVQPPITAPTERFFPNNDLPPPTGEYVSPQQWHAAYANGIIISNASHKRFLPPTPPPGPGDPPQVHTFNSHVEFDVVQGLPVPPGTRVGAPAVVTVMVAPTPDPQVFQTEMLQLDIQGGALPPGVMIRESPTLQSAGQTTVRPVTGGYMIGSFFDIFTEISTDGGANWVPAGQPGRMDLDVDPTTIPPIVAPSPLLPPPNDRYVSPAEFHVFYANGIILSNASHSFFTSSNSLPPPPPGGPPQTHQFSSLIDAEVGNQGGPLTHVRMNAMTTVQIRHRSSTQDGTQIYETEMLALSLTGAATPPVMIRESPTRRSTGGVAMTPQADGTHGIGSFFDIWTELSLDGGANWVPADQPTRVHLVCDAPEIPPQPTPNLPPPGDFEYVSPERYHILAAQGIIISNVSHNRFTQSTPPPPPGGSQVHNFSSQVEFDYHPGGGAPASRIAASAMVQVQVTSTVQSGPTRYFDTEMLALNIQGGGLPAGVMIRESPSRASLGRTSVRQLLDGTFRIGSFFDIFTEVTTDGGQNWLPAQGGPSTMSLRERPLFPPVAITCPADMTVPATGPNGAVVNYVVSASGGCDAVPSIVCNPPSGSTFPIGTTIVNCTASDSCGQSATCSFKVTVTPPVQVDPPINIFPTPILPPPTGVYISPRQWHALYANGYVISNASHRRFLGGQPPPPGGAQTHSFSSVIELEAGPAVGGPLMPVRAMADVTVRLIATPQLGVFDTEMLAMNISGGTFPANIRIRESPTRASTGRTTITQTPGGQYAIDSFFDIFTELSLDGGMNWSPANEAGRVELRNDPTTVEPIPAPTTLLPPRNDKYVSPRDYHIALASGIIISNISHQFFTQSLPPPPPNGPPQTHQFDSQVDMLLSQDGGMTFRPVRAPAATQVQIQHRMTDGMTQIFDTEMLALSLQGGDLPPGVMIRESPTRRSTGGTAITPEADGTHRIGSFFDVFTELSLDGGANWEPAGTPARVELRCEAPEAPFPDPNLPPQQGEYVSPQQYHILLASGITVSNVSHNRFTQSTPPPLPGGSQEHEFDSQVTFDYRPGSGQPSQRVSAPAHVRVRVTSTQDEGNTRYFDTEMLALDIVGGGLPAGVRLRESPTRQSLGRTSIREVMDPDTGIWDYVSSFFDVFTELSVDGGANWQPAANGPAQVHVRRPPPPCAITIACPADVTVTVFAAAGAVVNYPPPTVTASCPPVTVVCSPPSGSTFPVGMTTVNCTATDSQGNSATCSFKVTVRRVKEVFFKTNSLPPLEGLYITPARYHQLYAMGIIIKDVRHRRFTQSTPPPPPGQTQVHTFSSTVDMQLSTDDGATFNPVSVPAMVAVRVVADPIGGTGARTFDTEMLQLTLSGLPNGVMIRESPTRASTGRTSIRQVPGGYMIGSFFDVFTELSVDGGQNWLPAADPAPVELRNDPRRVEPIPAPTPILPPRNDFYISPALFHQLYQNGIIIRDVRHKFFTRALPPPPAGVDQVHQFDSQVDARVSSDGGQTFQPFRAPAGVMVQLSRMGGDPGGTDPVGVFDTEMVALNISGGDLPPGAMLRESPTEPSHGMTEITRAPDGTFRISSFFDIFTEISLNGGGNWSPGTSGPVRVELRCEAPEQTAPTNSLPPIPGEYVSPQQFHALYANGVILSNASHRRFTDNQPPPPPGGSQTHSFGSVVEADIAPGPGQPFRRVMMQADVQVRMDSTQDFGNTRYFDTEMLSLNLSDPPGPGLPNGVMIRESPTRASIGRTSIRDASFHISSFFDIFTEISLDGGMTWSPSVSGPVSMALEIPTLPANCPRVSIALVPGPGIAPQVRICWDAAADDQCILQFTRTLSPIVWQPVTAPVQIIGGQKCVTLPLQGQTMFFRLCAGCPNP